jgi:hypothetical protein
MRAVRREASQAAVNLAAKSGIVDQLKTYSSVRDPRRIGHGPQQISNWLTEYRDREWFKGWLLRGEDAPSGVKVVTLRQATTCRAAWHYSKLRRGIASKKAYHKWIVDKLVPDSWRPWLFGGDAPTGGFVVSLPLQQLRKEQSAPAILAAAGLDPSTFSEWKHIPIRLQALEWIVAWAAKTGARENLSPPWPEAFATVPAVTRNNMLRYAKAAKLSACCERAELRLDEFHNQLAKAERAGVRDLLEKYLRREPPFSWPFRGPKGDQQFGLRGQRFGLIANNLFVPTHRMIRFRDAARVEAERLGLARVAWELKDTPGFCEWFLDWTNQRGSEKSVAINGMPTPPANTPMVTLTSENGPVFVCGKKKPPLSPTKYRIIKALLDAWPSGLRKDALALQGNYSDPHKMLKELCDADTDWAEAIDRHGRGYRAGYRIR